MNDARFDAWTRRRFGLAAGGLAAALIPVIAVPDAAARKRKKKRCVRPGNPCRKSRRARRCCDGLACAVTVDPSGRFCCHRQRQTPCATDRECCGRKMHCSDRNDDPGPPFRCCGSIGASCGSLQDCCGALACDASADPQLAGLRCCLPPGAFCVVNPGEPDPCCQGTSCSGASKCE